MSKGEFDSSSPFSNKKVHVNLINQDKKENIDDLSCKREMKKDDSPLHLDKKKDLVKVNETKSLSSSERCSAKEEDPKKFRVYLAENTEKKFSKEIDTIETAQDKFKTEPREVKRSEACDMTNISKEKNLNECIVKSTEEKIAKEIEACEIVKDKSETFISLNTQPPLPEICDGIKNTVLRDWYIAVVPNKPKITNIPQYKSPYWIVLVGQKEKIKDLWHSSLVIDRKDNNTVVTSSGKIYLLQGKINIEFMGNTGFSKEITDSFLSGFPSTWKSILINWFSSTTKKSSESIPVSQNKKKAASIRKIFSHHEEPSKIECNSTTTSKTLDSPEKFSSRGRPVIKPLPFWENKYISDVVKSSPINRPLQQINASSPTLKRKWGNIFEM